MLKALIQKVFRDPQSSTGKQVRQRQLFRVGLIVGVFILFMCLVLSMRSQVLQREEEPPTSSKSVTLASNSVDVRDVWSHRLQKQAEAKNDEVEALRHQNNLLKQRLDALESLAMGVFKNTEGNSNPAQGEVPEELKTLSSGTPFSFQGLKNKSSISPAEPTVASPRRHPRMAFASVETEDTRKYHSDNYVVAGSYSKAALLSGLVVSTSVASQGNPQPVALRLLDSGNLPRGFTSQVKDAVLVGSCYGDLSSERAVCRINTLSFVEEDGTGVEISVEGWIFGEDGAAGLRGKVVDRAGEVARESLFAGILGGISNFLKHEATSSVFPVTPFGQTNALSTGNVLKGSLGSGASNALDKLAEFSIKRAESMQPVIVVNGGRRVDVLFKKGFSLKRSVTPTMKVRVSQ